jgi:serine/threonine-protein kinase
MDFGIARAINDVSSTMTSASAVMGTAQYLSPEQARGEVVDARSDLYSTGVVLFELLTGKPPFTGDSAVAIAYQHVSEMPVIPSTIDPGVSSEIDAVVMRALAKRADDRYQSASDFRADVERAIAGAPVTAAVPTIVADQTAMMTPLDASGISTENPSVNRSGRKGRKGRSSGVFWVLSFVAITAAIIGAVVIGRFLVGSDGGNVVTVPSLDGLSIEQAAETLAEFELRIGAQTPEISERPEGTIIAQQPAAGEAIETGQAVNVTVSTGREQSTVPQLVGLTSLDDVRIALSDFGLALGAITEGDSNQPGGYVLEQDPGEGTQVAAGSAVDIVVSSGLVEVPDVTGATEAQARSDLAQAGFEVQVVEQASSISSPGQVLAQSPQPGTQLARGSLVTITVALAAPEPTPTPTPTPTPEPTPTEVPVPEPTDIPVPTETAAP